VGLASSHREEGGHIGSLNKLFKKLIAILQVIVGFPESDFIVSKKLSNVHFSQHPIQ
jgi:hypothetical protein